MQIQFRLQVHHVPAAVSLLSNRIAAVACSGLALVRMLATASCTPIKHALFIQVRICGIRRVLAALDINMRNHGMNASEGLALLHLFAQAVVIYHSSHIASSFITLTEKSRNDALRAAAEKS